MACRQLGRTIREERSFAPHNHIAGAVERPIIGYENRCLKSSNSNHSCDATSTCRLSGRTTREERPSGIQLDRFGCRQRLTDNSTLPRESGTFGVQLETFRSAVSDLPTTPTDYQREGVF